ncbi:MAG: ISL3 family transposase [Proteobacteria bacterium]|nr:ISL3 family transposase [Pseudomonadota bacterium]
MASNILNLAGYKVVRVEEDDHDYHITADVLRAAAACTVCGSSRIIGHGRNQQVIRDLPMHGKRVGIYVDTRRWRCTDCQKTFMETLPAVDAKREMTDRLVAWMGVQSMQRTFASIAEDVGLNEKTVRNVFRDHLAGLEEKFHFQTPEWMGIDEIKIIRPRCVVSNIRSRTVVNMLDNRNKTTVARYLTGLQGKQSVQFVAIDMWGPYRDAVRTVLPQAHIIIDKFHVVRMANDALEKIRKNLRSELSLKAKRALMHDRFVLLKRRRDLTDKDRFLMDGWTKNYPLLAFAYELKEDFYGIYELSSSAHEATRRFDTWHRSIPPEVRKAFGDLIRAFQNWMPYILNYFKHPDFAKDPVTNAYTESLNNLIRVTHRMGRGYSFEALRAKILFTQGAHKHELKRPKFERRRTPQTRNTSFGKSSNALEFGYFNKSFQGVSGTFHPQDALASKVNYGSDINTLVELLGSGKL